MLGWLTRHSKKSAPLEHPLFLDRRPAFEVKYLILTLISLLPYYYYHRIQYLRMQSCIRFTSSYSILFDLNPPSLPVRMFFTAKKFVSFMEIPILSYPASLFQCVIAIDGGMLFIQWPILYHYGSGKTVKFPASYLFDKPAIISISFRFLFLVHVHIWLISFFGISSNRPIVSWRSWR